MIEATEVSQDLFVLSTLNDYSLDQISTLRLPNGLIPASLGRSDDHHFAGKVWPRDMARAVESLASSHFRTVNPNLSIFGSELYLSTMKAIFELQEKPDQLARFRNKPNSTDGCGYYAICDRQSPAVKFTDDKYIYEDWGHNQPDTWGVILIAAAKGIKEGLPVLSTEDGHMAPGAILQEITSYLISLKVETAICRSMWEHGEVWSPYSTRRIVLAGLKSIEEIWMELENDSKIREYPLKTSLSKLTKTIGSLEDKAAEHFPADYTDTDGHYKYADLASLVVLNDTTLPEEEEKQIVSEIPELEKEFGLIRYEGDRWKKCLSEAAWPLGKALVANYFFRKALSLLDTNQQEKAENFTREGMSRMTTLLRIKNNYGYIPELFIHVSENEWVPNNNELAWTLGATIKAASVGTVAVKKASLA